MVLSTGGFLIAAPAVPLLDRISRALLYGVGEFDIPVLALAMLVLLVFAALAGIVPARRAARLDPMSALRCE